VPTFVHYVLISVETVHGLRYISYTRSFWKHYRSSKRQELPSKIHSVRAAQNTRMLNGTADRTWQQKSKEGVAQHEKLNGSGKRTAETY